MWDFTMTLVSQEGFASGYIIGSGMMVLGGIAYETIKTIHGRAKLQKQKEAPHPK